MEEIREMKHICHHYFNEYVRSTLRVNGDKKHYQKKKRNAYHRLAQELRTDAFKCHFGNMNTIEELNKALTIIKGWLIEGVGN